MPLGLLELGVASFGVLGGYNLGQRIRQLVYDEDVARGKQVIPKLPAATHLPKHARNKSLSKLLTQQNTVTVMLVGEAAVDKDAPIHTCCRWRAAVGESAADHVPGMAAR